MSATDQGAASPVTTSRGPAGSAAVALGVAATEGVDRAGGPATHPASASVLIVTKATAIILRRRGRIDRVSVIVATGFGTSGRIPPR